MSDKNIINLDELLGQEKLFVQWEGEKYALRRSEDLSPEEMAQVMDLGERFTKQQGKGNDGLSKNVIEAVGEMMKILSPELSGIKMPFTAKVMILEFWKEQEEKLKKLAAKASQPW